MKNVLLLLSLLSSASAAQQTIATIQTPTVNYILQIYYVKTNRSSSGEEYGYELQALRSNNGQILWRSPVEPEARELFLSHSLLLVSSCFGGAYLTCQVQAFNKDSGKEKWHAYGALVAKNTDYVLQTEQSLDRQQEDGGFFRKYSVTKIENGLTKTSTLIASPRKSCQSPTNLVKVQKFSIDSITAQIEDSCGSYTRIFK